MNSLDEIFKSIRRKDRELELEETLQIITNGEYGVLSTMGNNGYPYGVALNYVYFNNSIYFHCAKEGQKLDNIKNCNKVSFCVVYEMEVLKEEFSTKYKSAVLFGEVEEILENEKSEALFQFIKKYSPEFLEKGKNYIEKDKDRTKVYRIKIDHISGKHGR